MHLTSAVRRKIFQNNINHGKKQLKFLLLFVQSYSLGKLSSKTLKHNEIGFQQGRRQLRLVFPLMLQVYATRGPTSYHKYNFARLLTILFSTRLVSKRLSLHSKVFRKGKVFFNDFFHRIYLHVEMQHFDMSRLEQLFARHKSKTNLNMS